MILKKNLKFFNLILHYLILKVPNTVAVSELFTCHSDLWKQSTFKAAHVKKEVRVVLAVH